MKGNIVKFVNNSEFVIRTIRRIARDETYRIGFPQPQDSRDRNPDGVSMSNIWHCLENAVITYGPIAESNSNVLCNIQDTYAGVKVELSLSIEYVEGQPYISIMQISCLGFED